MYCQWISSKKGTIFSGERHTAREKDGQFRNKSIKTA